MSYFRILVPLDQSSSSFDEGFLIERRLIGLVYSGRFRVVGFEEGHEGNQYILKESKQMRQINIQTNRREFAF